MIVKKPSDIGTSFLATVSADWSIEDTTSLCFIVHPLFMTSQIVYMASSEQ